MGCAGPPVTLIQNGKPVKYPDYVHSTWFLAGIVYLSTVLVFLFHTKYHRMEV